MSTLSQLKLGLALVGLILFGYGLRAEDDRMRWIGVVFLAAAAALRFVKRRGQGAPSADDTEGDER